MLPKEIPQSAFPLIVFADHSYGWIESFIKMRTKGIYNHVMWAIAPDTLASQGGKYSKFPFSAYMKNGNRLKFVEIIGLNETEKQAILDSINEKLAKPWWNTRYDYIGIIGQAIGIKKVNNPWIDYCSEDVVTHLVNKLFKIIPNEHSFKSIIKNMPTHGSPQDLNEYIKKYPENFKTYLRWESDAND